MAAKTKAKPETEKKKLTIPKPADMWDYYQVSFLLCRDMFGTATSATLYRDHIQIKNKKEIEKANALNARLTKALEKYKGTVLSPEKEVKEIQLIITTFGGMIGEPQENLPDDMDKLMEIAKDVEAKHNELVKKGESAKATIFMKEQVKNLNMPDGIKVDDPEQLWPVISAHMLIGNFKENAKITSNNGDKSIFQYKTTVSEVLALDVKPLYEFMVPDHDVQRKEDGSIYIDERPIRFINAKGQPETAISSSEILPEGTTFGCILRVRRKSPITKDALKYFLELGKNNGLGAWRGSGHKGAYFWKLKELKNYKEEKPKGWN